MQKFGILFEISKNSKNFEFLNFNIFSSKSRKSES